MIHNKQTKTFKLSCKVAQLLQKVKNISWDSKHEKDINDENFGYNLKGELKMLDI